MQLEEETRTDIEELYIERIAAYNRALNERLEKIESSFDKKQLEILRAEKQFLEMENVNFRKQLTQNYKLNTKIKANNSELINLTNKLLKEKNEIKEDLKILKEKNERLNSVTDLVKVYKYKSKLDYIKKLYKEGKPFTHLLEK